MIYKKNSARKKKDRAVSCINPQLKLELKLLMIIVYLLGWKLNCMGLRLWCWEFMPQIRTMKDIWRIFFIKIGVWRGDLRFCFKKQDQNQWVKQQAHSGKIWGKTPWFYELSTSGICCHMAVFMWDSLQNAKKHMNLNTNISKLKVFVFNLNNRMTNRKLYLNGKFV